MSSSSERIEDRGTIADFDLDMWIMTTGATEIWRQSTPGVERDLIRAWEAGFSEVMICNVTYSQLKALENMLAHRTLGRVSVWSASKQTAIIQLMNPPREPLHRILDDFIRDQVVEMGLGLDWDPVGASTYENVDIHGTVLSRCEGDSARKPFSSRPLGSDFPTLVIEGGVSETWRHLHMKAGLWFKISAFTVKVVVLAKIARSQPGLIKLEIWNGIPPPVGYPATRNRPQPVARRSQQLEIRHLHGTNGGLAASHQVTGGPIILAFTDLFDRAAANPREMDVVVSDVHLRQFAAKVFQAMQP